MTPAPTLLALEHHPRIDVAVSRVTEVESIESTLALACVSGSARLDAIGYSISIIGLISREYGLGADAAADNNSAG